MNILNFELAGLTCEACVKLASSRIKKVPGVENVEIEYSTGKTKVRSNSEINLDLIKQSLEGMTFKVVN